MPPCRYLILASAFAVAAATTSFAAESAYSDFPFDNPACKSLLPDTGEEESEGGSVSMVCPGHKGFDVYYKDSDGRVSVHYGHLSADIVANAWESFGPFNSVGEKIEWRLDGDGVPFAAIHRYTLANFNPDTGMADEALKGQVLVVSRVGRQGDESGCFVGLVDALANTDANELAREVAKPIPQI